MPRAKKETVDVAVEEKEVSETQASEQENSAPPKRKRGRPRKVVDNSNASGSEVGNKEPTKNTNSENAAVDKAIKEPDEAPKKRRGRKKSDALDPYRDERMLLRGARQARTILSAMIERVEFNPNMKDAGASITAIVQYKGFRVIIPASEMGLSLDDSMSHQDKETAYQKYINPMIGADIDFVVVKVDDKANLAIGSRRIAMAIQKKQIYQNRNRAGGITQAEWALEHKTPIQAKVVSVAGSTVKIVVYGIECKVLARDADWIYTTNLSDLFSPGDEIKCVLKSIEVNPEDKNDIKITASIKEAYPNRQVKNAETFKDGSMCVGTVTGIGEKGVYVLLGDRKNGISGFCNIVHGSEYPQVGDKVVCKILEVNSDDGFAVVKITRFIQKKNHNRY